MKIRTFLLLTLVSAVFITIVGCEGRIVLERAESERQLREEIQKMVAERIRYVRDPRTGLCFAYLWENRGTGEHTAGGPALAAVPCGAVIKLLAPSQQLELGNGQY